MQPTEITKINGHEFEIISSPPRAPRRKHTQGKTPVNRSEDTIVGGRPSISGFHIRDRISRKIDKAKAKFHEFGERLSSRFSSKQQGPQPDQKIRENRGKIEERQEKRKDPQQEEERAEQHELPIARPLSDLLSKQELAKLSSLDAKTLPEQIASIALEIVHNPAEVPGKLLQTIEDTSPEEVLENLEKKILGLSGVATDVAQTAGEIAGQALDIAGNAAAEATQTAGTMASDAVEGAIQGAGSIVQAAGTAVEDIAYELFVPPEQKQADAYFAALEERSPDRYESPEKKAAKEQEKAAEKLEKVAKELKHAEDEAKRARNINDIIKLDASEQIDALKKEPLWALEEKLKELQKEETQKRNCAIHTILDVEPALTAETLEQMPLNTLEQLAQHLFAQQQASIPSKSMDVWDFADGLGSIAGSVVKTVGAIVEDSLSAPASIPTQTAPSVPTRRNISALPNIVEVEI